IFVEEYSVFLVQCTTEAIPPATFKWQKRINFTHWGDIGKDIEKVSFSFYCTWKSRGVARQSAKFVEESQSNEMVVVFL
uniref:hypothetical protein n=1 Tax=Acinetobacter baumannii TaxID=470 RepID=UPI001C074140